MDHSQISFLKQDYLHNALLLSLLNNNQATIIDSSTTSLLLYDKISDAYYLNDQSINPIDLSLLQTIKPNQYLVLHNPELLNIVLSKGFMIDITCYNAVYTATTTLPLRDDVIIKQCTFNDLEIVMSTYSHPIDQAYIQDIIINNQLYASYYQQQFVGYVGYHKEGSIGMLEVLKDYQRQGFASHLLSFMVNQRIKEKKIAFSQIEYPNLASRKLHQKLHFEFSSQPIYWLKKQSSTHE